MEEEIRKSLEVLRGGGIILYPTDTIWGLGCDATNEEAVKKIFKIKERVESKSLILLLDDSSKLNKYLRDVPGIAWDLIEVADKPLTIVYDDPLHIAPSAIDQVENTVAIRITNDGFCKSLIHKLNKPLISTSANKSGEPFPAGFSEIHPDILKAADYIVNLRRQEKNNGTPSVIMKINKKGEIKILRK